MSDIVLPVRGRDFQVRLRSQVRTDAASAMFEAVVGEKAVSSPTLSGLRDRLLEETKRQAVKVRVPFSAVTKRGGKWEYRAGVATGVHATSRKLLVRWSDGESEQLARYSTLMRPLAPEVAAEAVRVHEEEERARDARHDFEQGWALDVTKEVEAAIAREADSG
jgi:hypothetical protein